MKILCFIGLHEYVFDYDHEDTSPYYWRECKRCHKRQFAKQRCGCGCDGMVWITDVKKRLFKRKMNHEK